LAERPARAASKPAGAAFLSYASEDFEATARIAVALSAAGIEVWFDREELRGVDAWDEKSRRQIKDCRLFIPVISANSESRLEGYFRFVLCGPFENALSCLSQAISRCERPQSPAAAAAIGKAARPLGANADLTRSTSVPSRATGRARPAAVIRTLQMPARIVSSTRLTKIVVAELAAADS
jgi:TIR domain